MKTKSFSDKLKAWRTARAAKLKEPVSQGRAAKELGVTLRAYQSWEQGVNMPSQYAIESIKEKMRV